jgi:hypothetical protein
MTQQFYQLVPLPNLFSISNTLISLLNPRCEHSISILLHFSPTVHSGHM